MTYAVFIKHQKTGDTAFIETDGESAEDAIGKIAPALGEGWKVKGALEKKATLRTRVPERRRVRMVTFGEGPTQTMLERKVGVLDIMGKHAPRFAIFDINQLWNHDYGGIIPGVFLHLYTARVSDDRGRWTYIGWQYNVGLEEAVKRVLVSEHGHLVYAMYIKETDPEYKNYPGLYRLVMTRGV